MTLVWRNEIVNICAKPFFLFLLDIRRKTNSHVKHERDGPYSSRTPLSWIGQPGPRTPNSKRLGPDVHVQPAQPEPQCQPGADVSPHGQSGYDHDFLIYPTFPPLTTDSTTTWTIFYPILTSRPPWVDKNGHFINVLSTLCHVTHRLLSTDPHPPLLVHVVIGWPLMEVQKCYFCPKAPAWT